MPTVKAEALAKLEYLQSKGEIPQIPDGEIQKVFRRDLEKVAKELEAGMRGRGTPNLEGVQTNEETAQAVPVVPAQVVRNEEEPVEIQESTRVDNDSREIDRERADVVQAQSEQPETETSPKEVVGTPETAPVEKRSVFGESLTGAQKFLYRASRKESRWLKNDEGSGDTMRIAKILDETE